jgi:hypothetical protein
MNTGVNLSSNASPTSILPPLIPRLLGGKRNLVPSPIYRGGLGWGNAVSNGQ